MPLCRTTTVLTEDLTLNPTITLRDGVSIPQIGFGTFKVQPDRSESEQSTATAAKVVNDALEAGYRHIDTAQVYGNERGVGRAIATSGLDRVELFITSKLGNSNHRPDDVRRSFQQTLENLGVDQLDLFLMHWPLPTLYDGDYVSTWEAMLELGRDGLVRSLGVSNFEPEHLERIIDQTSVAPSVNQIEVHPQFRNLAACRATEQRRIVVEAYSPLGRGAVLTNPAILRVAERLDKTAAQIILRWHLQHGHILIPKSVRPERMRENLAILDFELTPEQMTRIDALDDPQGRVGPDPATFDGVLDAGSPAPNHR
jgi:2,5-diketo-D-gluconate reductase A